MNAAPRAGGSGRLDGRPLRPGREPAADDALAPGDVAGGRVEDADDRAQVGRLAKAVGAAPASYSVRLRLGGH